MADIGRLCRIREIQRGILHFETQFEEMFGISLNEGMALCSLKECGCLKSGEVCQRLGLTGSNTSKILRSVEAKGLVTRELGETDHRQMIFSITDKGLSLLEEIEQRDMEFPELLRTITDII